MIFITDDDLGRFMGTTTKAVRTWIYEENYTGGVAVIVGQAPIAIPVTEEFAEKWAEDLIRTNNYPSLFDLLSTNPFVEANAFDYVHARWDELGAGEPDED